MPDFLNLSRAGGGDGFAGKLKPELSDRIQIQAWVVGFIDANRPARERRRLKVLLPKFFIEIAIKFNRGLSACIGTVLKQSAHAGALELRSLAQTAIFE